MRISDWSSDVCSSVLAPRLGSLIELQGQVGEDWLWLYDGPLTGERMREGIEWVRNTQRISPPDLSAQDWTHIGEKLARFLRAIAHEPGRGIRSEERRVGKECVRQGSSRLLTGTSKQKQLHKRETNSKQNNLYI